MESSAETANIGEKGEKSKKGGEGAGKKGPQPALESGEGDGENARLWKKLCERILITSLNNFIGAILSGVLVPGLTVARGVTQELLNFTTPASAAPPQDVRDYIMEHWIPVCFPLPPAQWTPRTQTLFGGTANDDITELAATAAMSGIESKGRKRGREDKDVVMGLCCGSLKGCQVSAEAFRLACAQALFSAIMRDAVGAAGTASSSRDATDPLQTADEGAEYPKESLRKAFEHFSFRLVLGMAVLVRNKQLLEVARERSAFKDFSLFLQPAAIAALEEAGMLPPSEERKSMEGPIGGLIASQGVLEEGVANEKDFGSLAKWQVQWFVEKAAKNAAAGHRERHRHGACVYLRPTWLESFINRQISRLASNEDEDEEEKKIQEERRVLVADLIELLRRQSSTSPVSSSPSTSTQSSLAAVRDAGKVSRDGSLRAITAREMDPEACLLSMGRNTEILTKGWKFQGDKRSRWKVIHAEVAALAGVFLSPLKQRFFMDAVARDLQEFFWAGCAETMAQKVEGDEADKGEGEQGEGEKGDGEKGDGDGLERGGKEKEEVSPVQKLVREIWWKRIWPEEQTQCKNVDVDLQRSEKVIMCLFQLQILEMESSLKVAKKAVTLEEKASVHFHERKRGALGVVVVELDDNGIHLCDSQACPLCIKSLIRCGIAEQIYTVQTSECVAHEPVSYQPDLHPETLASYLRTIAFNHVFPDEIVGRGFLRHMRPTDKPTPGSDGDAPAPVPIAEAAEGKKKRARVSEPGSTAAAQNVAGNDEPCPATALNPLA